MTEQEYSHKNQIIFKPQKMRHSHNFRRQYFWETFRNNQQFRKFLTITALLGIGITLIVASIIYRLIARLFDMPDAAI